MKLNLYVDGSFYKDKPEFTYGGIVILDDKNNVKSIRRVKSNKEEFASMNNVGGELLAAAIGLIDCGVISDNKECTINLYYDYNGIKEVPTGGWKKLKSKGMIMYLGLFQQFIKNNPNIKVNFCKVKAHTGNKYNELADRIAKGNNCFEYEDVCKEEITI